MQAVGEYVQTAIDSMNGGAPERAVLPTARAIETTVRKRSAKRNAATVGLQPFVEENWRLVAFMGMPRALPLPLGLPFALKRIYPVFNVHHGAAEIVMLLLRETLRTGRPPAAFAFHANGKFAVRDDRLFLPAGLLTGLLGAVVFDPVNRDEKIGGDYWISISDFKMFVSELWGRRDLAERIMKFYLERE